VTLETYLSNLISNLRGQLPLHKEMEIQNSSVQSIAETSHLQVLLTSTTYIQLNTFKTIYCSLLLSISPLVHFSEPPKPDILQQHRRTKTVNTIVEYATLTMREGDKIKEHLYLVRRAIIIYNL
jgi:hypothetical protein